MHKIDIVTYGRLLHRLAHEEGFRSRFEANPGVLLQQMGINIPLAPGPLQGTLPSKEDLEGALRIIDKKTCPACNGPKPTAETPSKLTER